MRRDMPPAAQPLQPRSRHGASGMSLRHIIQLADQLETRSAKRETHLVYLGLGANLGDREAALRAARDGLGPDVEIVRCSSIYETPPWGELEQSAFLNAVCEARTALAPRALLDRVKRLERALGRVATRRWGPRVIDIDILLYNQLELHSPELVIPHSYLHQRAFVLLPLRELAPALRHPVLGSTVAELAAAVDDTGIKRLDAW